jgi:hypothetical protein
MLVYRQEDTPPPEAAHSTLSDEASSSLFHFYGTELLQGMDGGMRSRLWRDLPDTKLLLRLLREVRWGPQLR